jgi:sulfur relay (sulfurtransferase) complex TusBCD TusD component (DsrE family)
MLFSFAYIYCCFNGTLFELQTHLSLPLVLHLDLELARVYSRFNDNTLSLKNERQAVKEKENLMNVAYVFATSGHTASYKLGKMILPQLEKGSHGAFVVGMFFFDDNTYILRQGDPMGERLAKVAKDQGMLLMMCDQCALERGLASGEAGNATVSDVVSGVQVGCFPDLYQALSGVKLDQVITL